MTTSLALIKYRGRYKPFASIKALLKQLGMPKSVWGVRNFWEHWNGQFDIILHDAEKLYRARAVRIHPRRSSDDQEESKQLNALWTTIKRRFKRHTWLEPLLPKENLTRKQPTAKPPPGHYSRTCPLPQCGIVFFTKRKTKRYCCAEHHKIHWSALRYIQKIRPAKKRILIKCQFKSCGHLFWATAPMPGARPRRFCSQKCAQYFHIYKHREEHPDIVNARIKSWRDRNPEKHKAATKKWREEHREEINKRAKKWKRKWRKKQKKLIASANSKQGPAVKGHPLPTQTITENVNVLAHH